MVPKLRAKDPKKAKPSKPKILIFGKPGVRKTWVSLDFPSVYYIDAEAGADLDHYTDKLQKSGGVYMGPEDGANDMKVVVEEIVNLATIEHDYRTLVIDSYSKLYNTAIQEEYEKIESNGYDMDKTFGREKKPAISATRKMIRWFDRLDMNVILICHQKDLWKNGEAIGVTFDGWDKLEYELHLALRIDHIGANFDAVVTKSRLKQFMDGEKFKWSYEAFAKKYGKDIIEAKAQITEVASPDQVKALQGLLQAVKVDDATVTKWQSKAEVSDWSQMTSTDIQKCIDFLMKKLPAPAAA